MAKYLTSQTRKSIEAYREKRKSNLFAIYLPSIDSFVTPLQTRVKRDPSLLELQRQFAEYIAKEIRDQIKKRIYSQKFYRDYPSYSPSYMEWKIRMGFGSYENPNWWYNSGWLVEHIQVWRTGNIFVVGIPENLTHPSYKDGSGGKIKAYIILKTLEFGDPSRNIAPRPLFYPVFNNVAKHIGKYFEEFLDWYDSNKRKVKKNRKANPTQFSE